MLEKQLLFYREECSKIYTKLGDKKRELDMEKSKSADLIKEK